MALEEKTYLASVELLFPNGGINARWDTVITRDGEVISGPVVHRRGFAADELAEILPEIQGAVSADYVQLFAENAQQVLQIAQLQAALAEHQGRIADLNLIVAQRDAGIAELENASAQRQATLVEQQTRIADLDLIVAQRDARIAELENVSAQQQAGTD